MYQIKSQAKAIWEQFEDDHKTEEQLLETFKHQKEVMRAVIHAGVVKKPWYIKLDKVVDQDQSQALFLYSHILNRSIDLQQLVEIDKKFAEVIDLTAKRYSCRPSDIMLPNSNDIEKAVYDLTMCQIGTAKELEILKKQNARLKRQKRVKNG